MTNEQYDKELAKFRQQRDQTLKSLSGGAVGAAGNGPEVRYTAAFLAEAEFRNRNGDPGFMVPKKKYTK